MEEHSPIKQALYTIRHLRQQIEDLTHKQNEPIAIIGLGCHFPGNSNSPQSFWDLLNNGIDAITQVPQDRWNVDAYYSPTPGIPGKMYTRHGGFISRPDYFDANFFGISRTEAEEMDPQQRLLLEVSWEALEYAGISPESLKGSLTGIFMAMGEVDYARKTSRRNLDSISGYAKLGVTRSIGVGRIAYVLGTQGPTVMLDTSCSSSLLSVHLACQSLRLGECDLALAGGVNLILSPEDTIAFCALSALSPSGRCKTFDASADGYVRGEGCGIIVLKRLSKAIADGDNILSVIKGSAVNHDGHSNGLTAPNGIAQQAVITKALEQAQVSPNEVQYVETHGTGTPLGDPIEVSALLKVLGEQRSSEQPLLIGSVKTNIGHLESAAGIASLIKVVLSLVKKKIPPNLHFNKPNPYILWDTLQVEVPISPVAWPDYGSQPLAGISGFGMSGTNVHLVLSGYQAEPQENTSKERPHLFLISAKTEKALHNLIDQYIARLSNASDKELAEICYTTCSGRSHFPYRLCFVVNTIQELRKTLNEANQSNRIPSIEEVKDETTFLFPETSLEPKTLCEAFPAFKEELALLDTIFHDYLGINLESLLHGENKKLLSREKHSHLAYFATQYVLAKIFIRWGIRPNKIISRGIGNYAAACIEGSMNLKEALDFILEKEDRLQQCPEISDNQESFEITIELSGLSIDSDEKRLHLLAELYKKGININWNEVYLHQKFHKVILPTYPFQRERYWINESTIKTDEEILKKIIYESEVDINKTEFLKEHKVYEKIIFPATGYIAKVYQRACKILNKNELRLENIEFNNALVLHNIPTQTQLTISSKTKDLYSFDFSSASTENEISWLSHAGGIFSPINKKDLVQDIDIKALINDALGELDLLHFYNTLKESGFQFGSSFMLIKRLWLLPHAGLGYIDTDNFADTFESNLTLLDACFQVASSIALNSSKDLVRGAYLPVRINSIDIYDTLPKKLWAYAKSVQQTDEIYTCSISLLSPEGKTLGIVDSLQFIKTGNASIIKQPSKKERQLLHVLDWIKSDSILSYHFCISTLDLIAQNYILDALKKLNWNWIVGRQFSLSDILKELSIKKPFHRQIEHILHILTNSGYLKKNSEDWEITSLPNKPSRIDESELKVVEHELGLLKRCGVMLREVWHGEVDPSQLLQPKGDSNTLKRIYQESPLAKNLNKQLQNLVLESVKKFSQYKKMRILEIGVDIASPTSEILPLLEEYELDYIFADISSASFQKNQESFKNYSFVQHQLLNIEQEIEEETSYDIIIAANVLHSTRKLDQALTNLKKLLVKNGLLLILEFVNPHAWLDITFGLTEDWWRFEDHEYRSHYPLLSSQAWQGILERFGFTSPVIHTPLQDASQVVISAFNDKSVKRMPSKHWLICCDTEGFGKTLGKILAKRGHTYSLAYPDYFNTEDRDASIYSIKANDQESYNAILRKIPSPHAIINLWPLNVEPTDVHQENKLGYSSTLYWVKALEENNTFPKTSLFIITRGAQAVTKTQEHLEPQSAPIWGLGRSILLEYPELQCKLIDLDSNSKDLVPQQLEEELFSAFSESQVAYRNNTRYYPILKKIDKNFNETPKIDSVATYLISGGLKGLGLHFAQWLAKKGAKNLVLIGRNKPDASCLEIINEMEKFGTNCHIFNGDISLEKDVQHIKYLLEILPPLKGIIHSAGVLDDSTIKELTPQRFEKVFAPKIKGTWNLYQISQDTTLDFFVLFSSASSILGAEAQANYAAANAYLDTFAHYCNQQQKPCLSINWGPWSNIGAADSSNIRAHLNKKGFNYLNLIEGTHAFELLIGLSHAQVAVMSIDWTKFLLQYENIPTIFSLFTSIDPKEISILKQNLDQTDLIEKIKEEDDLNRLNTILLYLQQKLSKFAGTNINSIDPNYQLDQLGIDSLVAIELRRIIRTELDVDVPTSKFLQGFSLLSLSSYINAQMNIVEKMVEIEI